ncbi:MAG: hypothetical protein HY245_02490 [Rhizobiales bacterium]|nr:hypothetical protein [Hyphomicrobiales bacterium]MBI3672296.1 hypothetical protein [Hyphomicrobiales bacterium]
MTKLEKIEQDIGDLSPEDVAKLAEYRAELWDRQIEADAKAGRLDGLVEQAKMDIAAGKIRPL